MKLNLGCGRRVLSGFFNVDIQQNPKAPRALDLIADISQPLPLPDACADEVHAYHLIEHFFRWQANDILTEWKRLLKPGGLLVLELPNLEAACKNLLAGMDDQMCMWPLYGDWSHRDPYMMHKHGYTPRTIKALAEECGFEAIAMLPPQTHGARVNRDMRLEARK